MLGNLEKSVPSKGKKAEDILEGIKRTRTVSLKEAINEIVEQINLREALHKEMMTDIEKMKSAINNMTPEITAEDAKAVIELQKKLIEAEEMKVQEKLNCFRDIALLKKELREWISEFREKETRADLLNELISE